MTPLFHFSLLFIFLFPLTTSHFHYPFFPHTWGNGPIAPDRMDTSSCPSDFIDNFPLVLISMDGFRADFLSRGLTPTLSQLSKRGVYAPYMKPSYPSITFPNHYSIVTGMFPPAHGIIANRFTDPVFNATFKPGRPTSFQKRFWGGEPIWKTVENQGQIAATYFWPGSEVDGLTPTHWFPFKENTPFDQRVNQVLAWLDLPREERPRFITLYFHEPDSTGHDFGPDSLEVNDALKAVDAAISLLVSGLNQRNLLSCVNLLIVADHGMASAGPTRVIKLQDLVPDFDKKVTSLWNGVFARFNSEDRDDDDTVSLMQELTCKRKEMKVYHKKHSPSRWHIGGQRRIEDIVLDLQKGYQVDGDGTYHPDLGDHGYDNYFSEMNALFLAHGPSFKRRREVEIFQNVELYNLMCILTDSKPSPNNGTLGALNHLLVDPPPIITSKNRTPLPPIGTLDYDYEDLEEKIEDSQCIESNSDEHQERMVHLTWSLAKAQSTGFKNLAFWNSPFGLPELDATDLPSSLLLLHNTHITAYSRKLRSPLWVSFLLDGSGHHHRFPNSGWLPDVRLHSNDEVPVCSKDGKRQFESSGLSWKPLFKSEFSHTNLYNSQLSSNAIPMSKLLSNSYDGLSRLMNFWRQRYGTLQVVVGPVYDNNFNSLKDNYMNWKLNEYGLAVPTHLFVVITRCQLGFGGLHSCPPERLDNLAFILPQYLPVENCQTPFEYLEEFSAKVKDVELITGMRFYSGMSEANRVKQIIRIHSNMWGRESYANRLRSDMFGLKR